MTATTAPGPDDVRAAARLRLTGILLMCGAFVLFTLLDASAKWLGRDLPTAQIVWSRFLGHAVIGLAWYMAVRGPVVPRTAQPGLHAVRSLLLLSTTSLNFFAVQYLQLSVTAAVFFSTPLFVAALSVPLLGERVGPRRWAAIVVGFLGVLVIVRPGLGMLHWAVLLAVAAAVTAALYQISTRRLATRDDTLTVFALTPVAGVVLLTTLVPAVWVWPESTLHWVLLALTGVWGGVGHLLVIMAHARAPAPILAPFVYTQILYMTAVGYWVFGDVPDGVTLVGAVIVVGSGLYLWWRERRIARRGADPGPAQR